MKSEFSTNFSTKLLTRGERTVGQRVRFFEKRFDRGVIFFQKR